MGPIDWLIKLHHLKRLMFHDDFVPNSILHFSSANYRDPLKILNPEMCDLQSPKVFNKTCNTVLSEGA